MPLSEPPFQNSNGMTDESSDHDEDRFEDAEENLSTPFSCRTGDDENNLLAILNEVTECLHLFFNNQMTEVINRLKPKRTKHMYYALGCSSIHLIGSLMTYDPKDVEQAYEYLTEAVHYCNQFRHKSSLSENSITKLVKRPNYNNYTEDEIHAELIHAELLLLWSLACILHEGDFFSVIRVGLRLRTSYLSYKECFDILEHRKWNNPKLKMHFKSGVLFGLGAYNLVISLFLSRFKQFLAVVGFSVNAELGFRKLDEGVKTYEGLRAPLCSIGMLFVTTVLNFAIGIGKVNVEYCKSLADSLYEQHPKGTIVLYFMARIHHIQGNIKEAIFWLKKSISDHDDWKQFKFMCYWDLQCCYGALCQWRQQARYLELIKNSTEWSKAIPCYMYASALLMCNDLSEEDQAEVIRNMKLTPTLLRRIAGRSLPMEKLYCKKAQRFFAQNNWLFLPAVEMMYTWNYFIIAGKNRNIVMSLLALIERAHADLTQSQRNSYYYTDNYCLGLFLKGICLTYMDSPLLAEECFQEVCQNYENIRDDKYLVPWALYELGQMNMDADKDDEAEKYFKAAKKGYTKFSLESRLRFKIHAALKEIKLKRAAVKPLAVPQENFGDCLVLGSSKLSLDSK